mgnify:CR=1 FL=1
MLKAWTALVGPARGGAIEEFTIFALETNFANVLTRRREGYHEVSAPEAAAVGLHDESGAPSIHDLETSMRLHELPPLDAEDRVLLTERVLGSEITRQYYERGDYEPAWRASGQKRSCEVTAVTGAVHGGGSSNDAGRAGCG